MFMKKWIRLFFAFMMHCILCFTGVQAQVKPIAVPINKNIVKDLPTIPQPGKNDWPELKKGPNGLVPRYVPPKPDKTIIDKKGTIAGFFAIKFAEGSHVRLVNGKLVMQPVDNAMAKEEQSRLERAGVKWGEANAQLNKVIAIIERAKAKAGFELAYMFQEEKGQNKSDNQFIEKVRLEQQAGEELADLDLYYIMYANNFMDAAYEEQLLNELNGIPLIEQAYPAVIAKGANSKTMQRPSFISIPVTPNISDQQGYLDAAPRGLDARYAWTIPGGRGDGIRVIDVEYDWVTDHEDFPSNYFIGGRRSPYIEELSNHGTAVMGVLASPDNGIGITGFVPNISYGLISVLHGAYIGGFFTALFSFDGEQVFGRTHNIGVAASIGAATNVIGPGNVILIEQHTVGPITGRPCPSATCGCDGWEYVPMEYYPECFDIIRRATANGIIVVEAAANGGQNLDAALYQNRFNRTIRNSRAILVGAANNGDRMTACFSNNGTWIDVHAWGDRVVTIGYGDGGSAREPFNNRTIPTYYTAFFNGTSSASPMVAGAVASIQGARRAAGRLPLSPFDMRNLLVRTGTPQISGGLIGPQPNLGNAIPATLGITTGYTGPGVYTIRSKSSGKVLDIAISATGGRENGLRLQQWAWHGGENQQFRIDNLPGGFVRIIAVHSGKALDVPLSSATVDGAKLQQWDSHGRENQQFTLSPMGRYYKIVCRSSGKVLDVEAMSANNGAAIQQWTSLSGDNQLFELIRIR